MANSIEIWYLALKECKFCEDGDPTMLFLWYLTGQWSKFGQSIALEGYRLCFGLFLKRQFFFCCYYKFTSYYNNYKLKYLLWGIGALKRDSAGKPCVSKVQTLTPYGLSSSRRASAQPSTALREAVKAVSPSPTLPEPKKIKRPLL